MTTGAWLITGAVAIFRPTQAAANEQGMQGQKGEPFGAHGRNKSDNKSRGKLQRCGPAEPINNSALYTLLNFIALDNATPDVMPMCDCQPPRKLSLGALCENGVSSASRLQLSIGQDAFDTQRSRKKNAITDRGILDLLLAAD